MGLFGGFKAKFTKDSTAKKNVNKDEVVCLGYRVYSEFDSPPQYLENPPDIHKKRSAIKTVAPQPKSGTNTEEFNAPQPSTSTPIETQIVTNPTAKKLPKKKAPATEKHVPTVSLTPTTIETRPKSAKNSNDFKAPQPPSTPTPIETQKVTKPKDKKWSKKKAPETEKHISTVSLPPTSNISVDQSHLDYENSRSISNPNLALITTEPVKLINGNIKESMSSPNSVYVAGQTSSFNPNINEPSTNDNMNNITEVTIQEVSSKPPKSILKFKSSIYTEDVTSQNAAIIKNPNNNIILTRDENIYSDNKFDRTLTMASSKKSESDGYATETVDYMSATQTVSENYSTSIATYVHTEVSNSSTDASINDNDNSSSHYSGSYNYSQNTRSIGNTSNHAANIFFGGDEEPEVQRPRRTNLALLQSEEERRSSAEC